MPAPGVQPSEEHLLELLPGCRGYLAGVEPISARALASADVLEVISRNGVGVDNIDGEAARRAGIRVMTTPGANAQSVAELAIASIFALARSIPWSDARVKAGGWDREIGLELAGSTLGIVGCGEIGKRVAKFACAIGMRVLGYDPFPTSDFAPPGFEWMSFADLCRESSIITLHAPAAEAPLVNADTLELLCEGVFIVNTARAQLVDTDALLKALDSGKVAGYAVDAHDREPPQERRLVEHPRVIATPHVGGYTRASVGRAALHAARNLLAALGEHSDG